MIRKKPFILCGILSSILIFLPNSVSSLSDDETRKLLDQVIRAHGSQRILSCNSVVLYLDVTLNPESDQSSEGKIIVKSNRFRLEYDMGAGFKYRMGYDGSQAWLFASPKADSPKKLDLLQIGLFQFYSLIFSPRWLEYLKSHAGTLKYGGRQAYEGASTAVLKANIESIGNVDFLIDVKTHLLKAVHFIFPGENRPRYEIRYDAYHNNDGIKVPGVIDIYRNRLHYRRYKVKESKVCIDVPDAVFSAATK